MLSDEWLSRYELLKNLHIKLCRSVTGTRTRTRTWTWTRARTTGVTAIALLVLRTGELKILSLQTRKSEKRLSKDYRSSFHAENICKVSKQSVENCKVSCAHKVPTVKCYGITDGMTAGQIQHSPTFSKRGYNYCIKSPVKF